MAEPKEQKKPDDFTPWEDITDGSPPVASGEEQTREDKRPVIDLADLDASIANLPPDGYQPAEEELLQEQPVDVDTQIIPKEQLLSPIDIFTAHVWNLAGESGDLSPLGESMQSALIYLLTEPAGQEDVSIFGRNMFAFFAPLEATWMLANERSDKALREVCMATVGALIIDPHVPQSDRQDIIRQFTVRPSDLMTYVKVVLWYARREHENIGRYKSVEQINLQAAFGALVTGFTKFRAQGLVPAERRDLFDDMELSIKALKQFPDGGKDGVGSYTFVYNNINLLEEQFLAQGK